MKQDLNNNKEKAQTVGEICNSSAELRESKLAVFSRYIEESKNVLKS